MAKTREELYTILTALLGSSNVYYQPPESIKMRYPAIVYSRSNMKNEFADNGIYSRLNAYEITVVERNADSVIPDKLIALPYCKFDRAFVSDNLYHNVFTLYF